jgi:hypothetical protein
MAVRAIDHLHQIARLSLSSRVPKQETKFRVFFLIFFFSMENKNQLEQETCSMHVYSREFNLPKVKKHKETR